MLEGFTVHVNKVLVDNSVILNLVFGNGTGRKNGFTGQVAAKVKGA